MKDLNEVDVHRLKITRNRQKRNLTVTQEKYIDKILKRFGMEQANPMNFPYASGVQLIADMSPKAEEEESKIG